MLYIICGEDKYSVLQGLDSLKFGIGPDVTGVNSISMDGKQITAEELNVVCNTMPFLSAQRLVVIDGLLERFEMRGRSQSSKKTNSKTAGSGKELLPFIETLTRIPDTTVVVLTDGKINTGNPLLKALTGKGEIRVFPLLRGYKLRQWIQKRVIQQGGKISSGAVELLAGLVGSDLWAMANEVEKLILYTQGRPIQEEDVTAITTHAQEATVFNLVDAILAGRGKYAQDVLHQQLKRGASSVQILGALASQLEKLVRAKELERQGKRGIEIQSRLGLAEFALQKTLDQAGKYTMPRLKFAYERLLDTDIAIKTGRYEGDLAMNILITELCAGAVRK